MNLLIAGEFKVFAEGFLDHVLTNQERGAPIDWSKANPVIITGTGLSPLKKASHPNTSSLFLEWIFSPQGLLAYEKDTGKGAAIPGSGTRTSKLIEGLDLIYQTENSTQKIIDLGLNEKFSNILGITPGEQAE